jgi:L-lysine 6-transaminase
MIRSVFDITIDFNKSHGSYLYDRKSNNNFLDLFSMFSSLPLGYNHPIFDKSFDQKIRPVAHLKMCNNLFNSKELQDFEKKFAEVSFYENIHLCATGALAVESAIKCGYEYQKDPSAIVLGVKKSFHGINSWGFLTDSEISSVKERVVNYPKNNWELHSLDDLIEKLENPIVNISSVIIEPIQCTAGDIYLNAKKLKQVQKLCNKNEICFIVDEIQTGFGVTGEMWYSSIIGLEPDVVIFGKKAQICGIMTNDKYSEAILSKYRKLEVTFDGDLVDAIRSEYIIKAIVNFSLLENVKEKSDIVRNEISEIFENYRSIGHLIAFDFSNKQLRDKFVANAYLKKLLVNPTGEKSVRVRPNLAFTDNELDQFINIVHEINSINI